MSRIPRLKCRIYLTKQGVCATLEAKGVVAIARNMNIKEARTERGMTQKDLAEAVGVSRQTINAIEQGECNPTIRLCRTICRVLGKTLDELFGEEEGMKYCAHCGGLTENDVCPSCGNRKLRPPEAGDLCFLVEKESLWSDMLADVLDQNGIPCMKKSSMGAGLAIRAGALFETFRFYVTYRDLERAQELVEELFSAKEEPC